MKIAYLNIQNFRGIKSSELLFDGHSVIVGDNNTGKSTILEAIDLVLGPERLSRYPILKEHDFFGGQYFDEDNEPIKIDIELIIIDLNEEQRTHFRNNLEWWNQDTNSLLDGPPAESTDNDSVSPAIRVKFLGSYDIEEDDFEGNTFLMSPKNDDGTFPLFSKWDKRKCGFLFLRTLRTGNRALSLEKGTLLDIILRLHELRPQMWEDVLNQLRDISVADDPELGISPILDTVQDRIRSIVPSEWASNPQLRVSNLTRAHLRNVLTVFMGTGTTDEDGKEFSIPFYYQGTGTINTLVLTLLSMIAELKENVIFAMEEPEIAIPPHTQKRVINSVTEKSAQAIFTSHSPYVLEEFEPSKIITVKKERGVLTGFPSEYPPAVKPKAYRDEFKRRFCETLLARRVLIVEGKTEYDAIPVAARRLNELNPSKYKSLESLGLAVINAETDSQIEPLGDFYKKLGKDCFAVFDKQEENQRKAIEQQIKHCFESDESSFEKVVLNDTAHSVLSRYALELVRIGKWPSHLHDKMPTDLMAIDELKESLSEYLKWAKGIGSAADILAFCREEEMPLYVRYTLESIKIIIESPVQNEDSETEETNLSDD